MAREIMDFGEKIGGARKDLYRSRGLKIEDLDDLNLKEYLDYVTKDNIWPVPDYKKYKGSMANVCIYYMKFVRDKIKAKTVVYGDERDRERAELYINFINTIKSICERMKAEKDIKGVLPALKTAYSTETGRWNEIASNTPGLDTNFVRAIDMSDRDIYNLIIECDIQGFPDTFRGDLKGVTVRKSYNGAYRLANNTSYLTSKLFNSVQEAIQYAKTGLLDELDGKKKTKKISSVVNVVRPQLEFIERVGPDIRNGVDATTDNLLELFKFRGGEFGNWNTQEDRQAYLNYAFDSFVDLAYVLGVPVDFISLGTHEDNSRKG